MSATYKLDILRTL